MIKNMEQKKKVYYIKRDEVLDFDCSSWYKFCNQPLWGVKNESYWKLHIIVKYNEGFFEILCPYLLFKEPFCINNAIEFLSHKFSHDAMKQLLYDAINSPNENLYVSKIQWMKNSFDCKSQELFESKDIYDTEGLIFGFPKWSFNEVGKKILCTISVTSTKLKFVISNDDFPTLYNTDHDGGWDVYTHEQHIVGVKKYRTLYEMQNTLIDLLNRKEIECNYSCSDVYNISFPFLYTTNIILSCSVCEFFSLLDIEDEGTIYKTNEGGAYRTEEGWLTSYNHGGTRGAWCESGWKYPSGYIGHVWRADHAFNGTLIWKFVKKDERQKELRKK